MSDSSTLSLHTLRPLQIELAAQQLIQESMGDPWGDISPAVYDTARILLLPRSLQPEGTVDFLLDKQKDDGSWGGPDAYCLVPSLAATASLLHLTLKAAQGEEIAGDASTVSLAAWRGLNFLASVLANPKELPDLVAIELIVPALVDEIEDTLTALADVTPITS
ncbi:MAG TPA: hypothetical protein V6C91_11295 [Coleofasciculaceae cyanobacterium]